MSSFSANPEPSRTPVRYTEAEVVAVSPDGFTVTVKTRDGRRVNAQLAVPQLSLGRDTDTFKGAGFQITPEVGAMALVATLSQGEHYVTGFIHPYVDGGYQGQREGLRPGDMALRSRNGAFLDVLASGLARLGASEISQVVCSPSDDSVRTVAQNYLVSTGLGNLLWLLDEKTRRGGFRVLSRSAPESDAPAGSLSLGDNPSGNLVELRTSSGKDSSFAIERAGNVRIDSSKDVTLLASKGMARVQARKIYLNCGSAKGKQAFRGNFYELPDAAVVPGSPAALAKFPPQSAFLAALPTPDAKRALVAPRLVQPTTPLQPVAEATASSVVFDDPLPKL